MIRKITADYICPVSTEPISKGVVIVDEESGRIQGIEERSAFSKDELEYHSGLIIPGLINAHCHLELSHMHGLVDKGTGLIPFITDVVGRREAQEKVKKEAMRQADRYMEEQGIVAVGDISNLEDSFQIKNNSRLRYHTFVEAFDLLQKDQAEATFEQSLQVYRGAPNERGHRRSIVPHAPYSVSKELFEKIVRFAKAESGIISMHNEETPAENELFRSGQGGFNAFYEQFDLSLETFQPTGKSSLMSVQDYLPEDVPLILVHNTLTTKKEIEYIDEWHSETYWLTCPNANLYIENRLPDYKNWIDAGAKICIGTDSLASNWQLSVLEEMRTIAKYNNYISFEQLLKWATLHGASALGYEDQLGSIEIGKTPGLKLISLKEPSTAAFNALDRIEIEHIL